MQKEYIHLYDKNIHYCIGCMRCRTDRKCNTYRDDIQDIAEKIKKADLLIIGSPTYWANMSSKLKTLFERMAYILIKEKERGFPEKLQIGKKAILALSCTTPFPFNILANQSKGAAKAIKSILKSGGYNILGEVHLPNTAKSKELTPAARKRIKKITSKI